MHDLPRRCSYRSYIKSGSHHLRPPCFPGEKKACASLHTFFFFSSFCRSDEDPKQTRRGCTLSRSLSDVCRDETTTTSNDISAVIEVPCFLAALDHISSRCGMRLRRGPPASEPAKGRVWNPPNNAALGRWNTIGFDFCGGRSWGNGDQAKSNSGVEQWMEASAYSTVRRGPSGLAGSKGWTDLRCGEGSRAVSLRERRGLFIALLGASRHHSFFL